MPVKVIVPALVVSEVAPVTPAEAAPILLIEIADALLTVRLESAVDPPTIPVKVIAPVPAVRARDCAPLTVPPKVIAPPVALVSIVLDPASVVGTALVITNELAVMFAPMLTLLVPALEEISIAPKRVEPPTAPVKVIAPVDPEFRVNAWDPAVVPLTIPPKVIAPPVALVSIVLDPPASWGRHW